MEDHISQIWHQDTGYEDNTKLRTLLVQDNSKQNLMGTRGIRQGNNHFGTRKKKEQFME